MAILNPPIEIIPGLKPAPSAGSLTLLNFLRSTLDDNYEIFFQPLLNGDCPDIVVMRKEYGAVIFEVNEWNFNNYEINRNGTWKLKSNGFEFLSPLKQANKYKENLFNLHVEELFNQHIRSNDLWPKIKCCVFFSNSKESEIKKHLHRDNHENCTDNYKELLSNTVLLGNDSLSKNNIQKIINSLELNIPSRFFDDVIYKSFNRYFQSPFHRLEEGKSITYTKEQEKLIISESSRRRKIKGVAGCGKTLVLSKLAVNAHKRTGSRVLILTYNITLKNYIRDRINDVKENFYWNDFYITNYHQFFKAEAIKYNLDPISFTDWQNIDFFSKVSNDILKYDVVLIDEIQDYRQEWIDIITKYFISESTEFIVFGDEKQNIYEREMDENNEPKIRTIPGSWNKSLNTSYRFSSAIGNIALLFQRNIFKQKYNIDDLKTLSTLDFERRVIEYHYFKIHDPKILYNKIFDVIQKNGIHPSDIGILGSKIETLREIDALIKTIKHEKTSISFESKEEYDFIFGDKSKIEKIRKVRKFHFGIKKGTAKLSTTHSFKGWEVHTLFLFIDNEDSGEGKNNAELIYTGITRARVNLIIFNLGKSIYDPFFKENIKVKYEYESASLQIENPEDDLPF